MLMACPGIRLCFYLYKNYPLHTNASSVILIYSIAMKSNHLIPTNLIDCIGTLVRRFIFQALAFGPIPRHIAFVPDGNRCYGKEHGLQEGEAHRIGLARLIPILKYCCELNVRYVSLYGFSIDNFKRKPSEVQVIMDLIQENTEALVHDSSIVNQLGVRVEFFGNLDLLDECMRVKIQRVKEVTAKNDRMMLLICVAYSSTKEIVDAVRSTCKERAEVSSREGGCILPEEMQRHMHFSGYPDPDLLIRTSGETRLSNFMLWQTACCLLYAPRCYWPEISLRHLVFGVLEYQRNYGYLEKVRKKME